MDDPAAVLLAAAAVMSAIGGVITAWAAARTARREDNQRIASELAACYRANERYVRALHHIRVAHPEWLDGDTGTHSDVIGDV